MVVLLIFSKDTINIMSLNRNTLRMVEEAALAYKNADTSNTDISLGGVHPRVREHSLMTRTTYVEFNPINTRAEIPSLFSRDYGQFLRIYVMLKDPNGNQIQVFIERDEGKIFLSRGWTRLRQFYGIDYGGWITLVYVNPLLLKIKVRHYAGHEATYPFKDPPHMLMLLDQSALTFYNGPVPYYVSPTHFTHTLEKTLALCDVETGVLKLYRSGFCENALAEQDCTLTIVDWMGFTWKCQMQLEGQHCLIYGEWKDICQVRHFIAGTIVKFGVVKPANNTVIYLKVSPFIGVRTTLVSPTTTGGYKAFYQVDNYYKL